MNSALLAFFRAFLSLFFLLCTVGGELTAQASIDPSALETGLKEAVEGKDFGKASFYSYELAKYYMGGSQIEQAESRLKECAEFAKKGKENMLLYLSSQRLGEIASGKSDYKSALDYYQNAQRAGEALNKPELISRALMGVGISNGHLKRYKRTIAPLKRALSISIQHQDEGAQLECYALLTQYHNALGESGKAREYQQLYDGIVERNKQLQESREQLMRMELIAMEEVKQKSDINSKLAWQSEHLRHVEDSLLSVKYSLEETEYSLGLAREAEEKQQLEIALLKNQQELADVKISEQNAQLRNEALVRNGIIAGIVLTFGFGFVIIRDYRKQGKAKKIIETQNKSIKSSIQYAQRIQEAVLPGGDLRNRLIPDSFILFKPRDVVSGDFYWYAESKSWYNPDAIVAAVDCTGHGIPGAFMSMIGMNALNSIVANGIAEPDQILENLDTTIRAALQQERTGNNDGMDVALCIYRKEKNMIEFSGAKSPLVYIADGQLTQIKGDTHPIGGSRKNGSGQTYKKHIVKIEKPTHVYLFSDGYRDQFGGDDNMKFMTKRFNKLLTDIHHLPMDEQRSILDKTIEAWRGARPQTDDILVMGFRLDVYEG